MEQLEQWLQAQSYTVILSIFGLSAVALTVGMLILHKWYLMRKLEEMRKHHGWEQED